MFDWIMDHLMLPLITVIGVACVCVIVFLGVLLYRDITTPHDTFTLRTDQWECTQRTSRTWTTLVPVGKVLVPVVNSHRVCTQWSER